jgi:hypothetical protein
VHRWSLAVELSPMYPNVLSKAYAGTKNVPSTMLPEGVRTMEAHHSQLGAVRLRAQMRMERGRTQQS